MILLFMVYANYRILISNLLKINLNNDITKIETYSTDETDTGKIWIDGKKIYRVIITYNTYVSISPTAWFDTGFPITSNNIQNLIQGYCGTKGGPTSPRNSCYNIHCSAELSGGNNVRALAARDSSDVYAEWLCIEYTKTTN